MAEGIKFMNGQKCNECFNCKVWGDGTKRFTKCVEDKWFDEKGGLRTFIVKWKLNRQSWWTPAFEKTLRQVALECGEFSPN